ncbi:MAG: hypothetical protein R6T96_00880, partial [Longimicrobiales bacterium]
MAAHRNPGAQALPKKVSRWMDRGAAWDRRKKGSPPASAWDRRKKGSPPASAWDRWRDWRRRGTAGRTDLLASAWDRRRDWRRRGTAGRRDLLASAWDRRKDGSPGVGV